jgi:hypothetical protein
VCVCVCVCVGGGGGGVPKPCQEGLNTSVLCTVFIIIIMGTFGRGLNSKYVGAWSLSAGGHKSAQGWIQGALSKIIMYIILHKVTVTQHAAVLWL